jgi:hypothetical protein
MFRGLSLSCAVLEMNSIMLGILNTLFPFILIMDEFFLQIHIKRLCVLKENKVLKHFTLFINQGFILKRI